MSGQSRLCQIIKVSLYAECYLLPTECQIIKVPLHTECYLLPTECQIIKVSLYAECYLLPTECQIIKVPLYTECIVHRYIIIHNGRIWLPNGPACKTKPLHSSCMTMHTTCWVEQLSSLSVFYNTVQIPKKDNLKTI